MSPKQQPDQQCQYQSPRGRRCHMLIDANHRSANGAARPTLCTYHASRLQAVAPVVDPEVLAGELLEDIGPFTTADEVNLFLGNLVRQLVRKRIARRDALALAYISQLILMSQTAMARQRAAAEDSDDMSFAHGLLQRVQEIASDPSRLAARVTGGVPDQGAIDPRSTA